MASDPRDTPAMQQYFRFKQRHPDCILLFRIGDFYEMFDQDAVTASKAIGLTLTQRTAGLPMAGVPFHQLENYLRKFIAAGFRVAVCEQIEPAESAKGLVARAVTRVLTPGTLVDDGLLEDQAAPTLAAVAFTSSASPDHPADADPVALAVVEVATGSFVLINTTPAGLLDELARRDVRELLFPALADGSTPPRLAPILASLKISATPRPAWQFRPDEGHRTLLDHYRVASLAGFGLAPSDPALAPAGAVIRYLQETQAAAADNPDAQRLKLALPTLAHLAPPRREDCADDCVLDAVSLRALEVERTLRGSTAESLLGLFIGGPGSPSLCRTALGKRTLRDYLCRPSRRAHTIAARHRVVGALVEDRRFADELGAILADIPDVARIAGRIALARATPRDLVALGRGLDRCAALAAALANLPALADLHTRLTSALPAITPLASAILSSCVESPPPHLRDGGLIKDGFDAELDAARLLQRDAGHFLSAYQERLIAAHDLPSLKVGFNKIFGYYIELPAAQSRRAPAEFTRKQTLKNAERYITPELHDFERQVTTAQARALDRERLLFDDLCARAQSALAAISTCAHAVGSLDSLLAFADHAHRANWTKPELVTEPVLRLTDARHPVLERLLGRDFVPSDLALGPTPTNPTNPTDTSSSAPPSGAPESSASLALITGPNMAGKSTFIRTAALCTLLAHAGSFVPAAHATIGLTDRIFTRIGADDALHAGQSTFMVEMTETANILNHVSPHSLVILDEIGRGTSTLDGLSLAWGITEFLADWAPPSSSSSAAPRVLFATHYHELTDLSERLPGRVKNLHVAVREWPADPNRPDAGSRIVFLHRILPGRSDQSYGIHVAQLAGLPAPVIARAQEVLASLAVHHGPSTAPLARIGPDSPSPTPTPTTDRPINPRAGTRPDPSLITAPAPRSSRHRAAEAQMPLFKEYLPHPCVDRLREVKLDSLSPIQAFDELRRLKELLDTP